MDSTSSEPQQQQNETSAIETSETTPKKKFILTIYLVDNSRKKIDADCNWKVEQLCKTVAEKLGVKEYKYFSIAQKMQDEDGKLIGFVFFQFLTIIDRYLDPEKTLLEEEIDIDSKLLFNIKHMKLPKNFKDDPILQELYFKQIQHCIIKEIYPCPERIAVLLASYEIQSTFGDYNPKKHRVGYLKYKTNIINILIVKLD